MTESALIMDIKRFAVHDGPGIRTTFFLKGCPLKCIWCHNPEGISFYSEMAYYQHKCINCGECISICPTGAHAFDQTGHSFQRDKCISCMKCESVCLGEAMKSFGRILDIEKAVQIAREDIKFYNFSNGGVTVSGGEPLTKSDFVYHFFKKLKADNIHTAVDTCGAVDWSNFEKVLPVTDMFLYDIKHIDSEAHKRLTGSGNERILDNLVKLSETGKQIEIRMPLVPGCNSDDQTVHAIGSFLGRLSNIEKMRILPYHSLARSKYAALNIIDTMPDVASPDNSFIEHVVDIIRSYGINVVSGRE